jgi:hypothetical protein
VNARAFQVLNLALLVALAGLLIALAAGVRVPPFATALVIAGQAIVRAFRELRFGTDVSRRRLPFHLLLSLFLVYLIMRSVPAT